MQRLDGHWVPKRVGIIEHYKDMTLAEIVLFDAYLLLANKQTWECWKTSRQLAEILPMNKNHIIKVKNKLAQKGWIQKINQAGVFIPKLYQYSPQEKQKSAGEAPIIEEGYIIEDDTYYLGSQNEENSGLCKLNDQIPERHYLHLLKAHASFPWIRKQKKLAKKAARPDRYFTLPMLERDCIIRKGIEGLDPDQAEDYQLKKWLRDHPEKKVRSQEERKEMGKKLAASRGDRK